MTNVFEQPWLLLVGAVVVFLIVGTWRAMAPEKNRWWQWCLPLAVALLGLGLDTLVATDREKVIAQDQRLMKAVTSADFRVLDSLFAPDYRDGLHQDRAELLAHTRSALTLSPVLKLTKLSREIESLTPSRATVRQLMVVVFEKESRVASVYKPQFFVDIRLTLTKQAQGDWLIQSIELLEVDKQPMHWGQIPGQVW